MLPLRLLLCARLPIPLALSQHTASLLLLFRLVGTLLLPLLQLLLGRSLHMLVPLPPFLLLCALLLLLRPVLLCTALPLPLLLPRTTLSARTLLLLLVCALLLPPLLGSDLCLGRRNRCKRRGQQPCSCHSALGPLLLLNPPLTLL